VSPRIPQNTRVPGKEDIMRDLLSLHNLEPGKTLFIGDTMADLRAANACGQDFLGRVAPGKESPFPKGTLTVEDLNSLS
jgi:phosphoglycolate phosphatase-like HAD superfamily hydrolase